MGSLDFKRCSDLFLASPRELAMALGIDLEELERLRRAPREAGPDVLRRLGSVLRERGRGMLRVGEMLAEEHAEPPSGNGGPA